MKSFVLCAAALLFPCTVMAWEEEYAYDAAVWVDVKPNPRWLGADPYELGGIIPWSVYVHTGVNEWHTEDLISVWFRWTAVLYDPDGIEVDRITQETYRVRAPEENGDEYPDEAWVDFSPALRDYTPTQVGWHTIVVEVEHAKQYDGTDPDQPLEWVLQRRIFKYQMINSNGYYEDEEDCSTCCCGGCCP